jgi:hypothetical protein
VPSNIWFIGSNTRKLQNPPLGTVCLWVIFMSRTLLSVCPIVLRIGFLDVMWKGDREWRLWKEVEWTVRGLFSSILAFDWKNWEKSQKTSVKITILVVGIDNDKMEKYNNNNNNNINNNNNNINPPKYKRIFLFVLFCFLHQLLLISDIWREHFWPY